MKQTQNPLVNCLYLKLTNGLDAIAYSLDDPQLVKIAEACEKPLLPVGVEAKIEAERRRQYLAVKVDVGEDLYLIYYNGENLISHLRRNFPEPFYEVFMIVYEGKAYLYLHRACRLLLKSITHKTPPKIMALLNPQPRC